MSFHECQSFRKTDSAPQGDMALWREERAFTLFLANHPLSSPVPIPLGLVLFFFFLCLVNWRARDPLLGVEQNKIKYKNIKKREICKVDLYPLLNKAVQFVHISLSVVCS